VNIVSLQILVVKTEKEIQMHNKYCNAKLIKKKLDNFVMGQEQGTRAIAMAFAQHFLRIEASEYYSGRKITKDNVLLVGPTGCGKTETFRVLKSMAEEFGVPVCLFNALDFAPTDSWKGSKCLASIFTEVFRQAAEVYFEKFDTEKDVEKQKESITKIANNAIIVLDEIDKLRIRGEGNNRHFLTEYQSVLLKMVEGNTYEVDDITLKDLRKETAEKDDGQKDNEEDVEINSNEVDTTNMMFVFMGAFDGIEEITRGRLEEERLNKEEKDLPARTMYQDTQLGFLTVPQLAKKEEPVEYTYEQLIPTQEDIIQFGFMRELVGRISVRTVYKPLKEDVLFDILLHCETSAYREYQQRFVVNGHKLLCNRDALKEISRIAVERGTGARGLRNIFSELLQDTMFELSGEPCHHCLLRGKEMRAHKPPLLHKVDRFAKIRLRIERERNKKLAEIARIRAAISGRRK
jgi:ATP-dependent Clp protease ATP-binding subunit ClpX